MLDIKFIRENAEAVKANCKRRKYPADIDTILEIDADIRKLTREIDEMRAERNRLSKLCGADPEARERVKAMKSTLAEKEELCAERQKKLSGRCATCKHFALCGGGFRTRAAFANGHWYGSDPGCYLTDEETQMDISELLK